MNKMNFTGNLTRDAESRFLASGTAILSFDVAVNIGFGDKKSTTYVKCALFGKRAEGKLGEYLVKGTKVAVAGGFSLDSREHEGKTYTDLKCFVDDVELLGSKSENQGSSNEQQNSRQQEQPPQRHTQYDQPPPPQGQPPVDDFDDFSDPIPF